MYWIQTSFFLTLEWAQLLVSVLCWKGTIYSFCSQGQLNSCPLAGIHIFPPNALTNRSCFSLLKQVAPTLQSSLSKVWSCQQEPWLSDKTLLSLVYSVVFFKEHSFGVTIYQHTLPTLPFQIQITFLGLWMSCSSRAIKGRELEPGFPEA